MLLDAASLYFRAFYGVPSSVRAPDGTPINAARGFLDMISTLVARFRPTHLVACLDEDWRPAWRVKLLPSYKTHRLAEPDLVGSAVGGAGPGEAEPPDLGVQVPIMLDILRAMGIAAIGAPAYEADDVIATLAERATLPVDIVTGDRDLFQLIDDERQVRVLYTGKGVAKLEPIDGPELYRRYGIHPQQYADYATLRGDASDGLPGVAGVGEKTAAGLLKSFGSLDEIMRAADTTDLRLGRVRAKIVAARDYLAVAPTVVRTARDVPLSNVDSALPDKPADPVALAELATQWGLTNAVARLSAVLER